MVMARVLLQDTGEIMEVEVTESEVAPQHRHVEARRGLPAPRQSLRQVAGLRLRGGQGLVGASQSLLSSRNAARHGIMERSKHRSERWRVR